MNHYRKNPEQKTNNPVVTIKEFKTNPKNIFTERADETVGLFSGVSFTQARRFYNQILEFKELIDSKDDRNAEYKRQLPYIYMLKAKANYAKERKKIDQNFFDFIENNIDELDDDVHKFDLFCTLFEAVIAYSKGKLKSN